MGGKEKQRREARQAQKRTSVFQKVGQRDVHQWATELSGSGYPNKHWFADSSQGLLDKRTITKLGYVWAALHVRRIENGTDFPLLKVNPQYRYLSDFVLSILESSGIPARSQTPLNFRYSDILLPYLPSRVNGERLFNNLVDVIYCYWSVQRGWAFLFESGLVREAEQSRAFMERIAEHIETTFGTPRNQTKSEDRGLSLGLMDAKWYADATITKIRALWDKSLTWLSRDFYGIELGGRSWGERTMKLKQKIADNTDSSIERSLLEAYISMCGELDDLRDYRDNDLHKISPRIKEALGRPDRDYDMLELLKFLDRETIRCLEGLMLCFAVVLAAAGKIPNGQVVNPSPSPI